MSSDTETVLSFDKEAYTGLSGLVCRYSGSAERGLSVELATGDVLQVGAEQIRLIFRSLGSHNPLLEECEGLRFLDERRTVVRRMARGVYRALRHPRAACCAPHVSSRFTAWLEANAASTFGREIDAEQALQIQAVFAGEGLLAQGLDGLPGEFPVAAAADCVRALQGRRVIYEERRLFAAVKLADVLEDTRAEGSLQLRLQNLLLPGFAPEFPEAFKVGGHELSMRDGILSAYMGLWTLVSGPGSVRRIVEVAARGVAGNEMLRECRKVMDGH